MVGGQENERSALKRCGTPRAAQLHPCSTATPPTLQAGVVAQVQYLQAEGVVAERLQAIGAVACISRAWQAVKQLVSSAAASAHAAASAPGRVRT